MPPIEYDTSAKWDKPVRVAVPSTGAVPLITNGYKPTRGIQIKALTGNGDLIYLGKSDVLVADGYPLEAGKAVFIPIDKIQEVYAIAGSGTQNVSAIPV